MRMAAGGMCSNESGMDSKRTFIGTCPSLSVVIPRAREKLTNYEADARNCTADADSAPMGPRKKGRTAAAIQVIISATRALLPQMQHCEGRDIWGTYGAELSTDAERKRRIDRVSAERAAESIFVWSDDTVCVVW